MPYVMVPVPAELEREVSQFVLRLTLSAALNKWDADSMARLFDACDPVARSVIVQTALGNLDGQKTSDRKVGEALDMAPGEVVELAMRVNAVCASNGWPALILMGTSLEASPGGGQDLVRQLVLTGEPARLALQVHESLGHPPSER